MRILLVIDHFGRGGAQRQLAYLGAALSRRGAHVEAFVYYPEYTDFVSPLQEAGVEIHAFRKRGKFATDVLQNLRALIKAGRYSAIVSYLDTPNLYAELACLGSRSACIVSERSVHFPGMPWPRKAMKWMHAFADHIVTNSVTQRDYLRKWIPWTRGKISTIYNGVDLDRFRPAERLPERSDREVRLLAISSNVPHKNSQHLIRAVSLCRSEGVPVVVKWLGRPGGTVLAKEYAEQAARLVEQQKLSSVWSWLGERPDVEDWLRGSDALIHPSFYEGLPNSVCEAMACGLPVLASRVCDHPYLVEEAQRGLLFDPADPEDIAEKIKTFCMLPVEVREAMGRRCRQYAEEKFSIDHAAAAYEDVIRRSEHGGGAVARAGGR